ncbi:hypothetical protein [Cohnella ginsengisoli]|uniref:hypothetical protein n=1 Tax=Cohnella ginsengisoli TaxID=425004 RepID=UPI002404BE0C|nr:hypothetical protein [Cohnella ginsengisoli]
MTPVKRVVLRFFLVLCRLLVSQAEAERTVAAKLVVADGTVLVRFFPPAPE